MRFAHGVEMLEISSVVMGRPATIYPSLLWEAGNLVLVDAGFPGQQALFREAIQKAGQSFTDLRYVILTHQDIDHIGSLAALLKELPGPVDVLAHSAERDYIQGDKLPLKLAQLEARLDPHDEGMKRMAEMLGAAFKNSYVHVNHTLEDEEQLPFFAGARVIHTPGHTPGHICLYLRAQKALIAGDALGVEDGELVATQPSLNDDGGLYRQSLIKLAQLDVESVICYHGGLFQGAAAQRIAYLAGQTNP